MRSKRCSGVTYSLRAGLPAGMTWHSEEKSKERELVRQGGKGLDGPDYER
jgi:hypothetical protein